MIPLTGYGREADLRHTAQHHGDPERTNGGLVVATDSDSGPDEISDVPCGPTTTQLTIERI
jgi:hypothetical protein